VIVPPRSDPRPCLFWVISDQNRLFRSLPLIPQERKYSGHRWWSDWCRFCCKSRKLHRSDSLVKSQNTNRSTIRITSVALSKSPMSLARGDEVPQISTRKMRLRPSEVLAPSAKRLLQQNLPTADIKSHRGRRTTIVGQQCGQLDRGSWSACSGA
jgi:hypothetical protein